MLTIAILSPLAVVGFSYGIPIEILVFGLLLAGYKGPQLLKSIKKTPVSGTHPDRSESVPKEVDAHEHTTLFRDDAKRRVGTPETAGLASWRAKIPWRTKAADDGKRGRDASEEILSWRSKPLHDAKFRKPRVEEPIV